MTATYERIKKDIRTLAPEEVDALRHDLQNHDSFPPQDIEEASIQAEWSAEIDSRMKEVEEGKVELITGAELRRSTDILFAQMGLKRSA